MPIYSCRSYSIYIYLVYVFYLQFDQYIPEVTMVRLSIVLNGLNTAKTALFKLRTITFQYKLKATISLTMIKSGQERPSGSKSDVLFQQYFIFISKNRDTFGYGRRVCSSTSISTQKPVEVNFLKGQLLCVDNYILLTAENFFFPCLGVIKFSSQF